MEAPVSSAAPEISLASNTRLRDDTFYVGLCMAGAVSAGAYTAGVMDYLIEALQQWEERRGQPGIPSHRVEIPIMGGASAGGMTSILTAVAINQEIAPVQKDLDALMKGQPQNPLYHSWVDLTGKEDMLTELLSNSDIPANNEKIYSLLNASFIQEIATQRVQKVTGPWVSRPYFSRELRVFATLSNLKGFVRRIPFSGVGESIKYFPITRHNDYACFKVDTTGSEQRATYNKDGWEPVNFRIADANTLQLVRNAAMATGAFPVGLRARSVSREINWITDNVWFKDAMDHDYLKEDPYNMDFVDGGLINNQPFDLVRDWLLAQTKQPVGKVMTDHAGNTLTNEDGTAKEERHDPDLFKGTVVMIDPFPSADERSVWKNDETLYTVISRTLSAMISHLRVKNDDVINAMRDYMAGQFLIAPSRRVPDGKGGTDDIDGPKAIACGSLGGFGGFINKEFRVHDFLLGRANCEAFLRRHFTVPADTKNPVFVNGYKGIDRERFIVRKDDGKEHLQIIPIFADEAPKGPDGYKKPLIEFPNAKDQVLKDWPFRKPSDVSMYDGAIRERTHGIIGTLVARSNFVTKTAVWLASRLLLNRKISGFVQDKMSEALIGHQLLLDEQGHLIPLVDKNKPVAG